MAKHRARSLRAFATTVGAVSAGAAVAAALLGAGSADALTPGKAVKAQNSDVIGKCTLRVMSYNPSDVTSNIRLSAQAQPKTLDGFGTNVYTQVFCSVLNPSGTQLLASYNPFANGARVQASSITPAIPYYPSYLVCATAYVQKSNGSTSTTPTVCA
jgi:hypothetical protein